jgi:hypothetical protein
MRNDLVYILSKGNPEEAFGNLKTLVDYLGVSSKYSTIWRRVRAGKGRAIFDGWQITRLHIKRAPYSNIHN